MLQLISSDFDAGEGMVKSAERRPADSIGIWKEEQKRNNHKTGATKVLKPIGKFLL